ncbi:MAG: SagB/ThcOx family dehydrogenase, partial [Gaiellaceae bacterium]
LQTDPVLQTASARRGGRGNPQRRTVALPAPVAGEAPRRGRSARSFARRSMRPATLGAILHAGYGVAHGDRRTVPSGGALYPLELYPVVRRAEGLVAGVYRYDPAQHRLELVRGGQVDEELDSVCALDGQLRDAATVVFLAAVFWRTRFKYGLRGYRFALLEAGHCAQNMLLAAHRRDVGALPLGGYYDGAAERLVEVDGVDEAVVYAVAFEGDT